jgi:hypothetical protein
MFITAFKDKILNTMRATSLTSWSVYAGFVSAVTDLEAGTVTELTYTGYARTSAAAMDAPGASGTGGGRKTQNTALLSGGQKSSAGSDTAIAVGIFDTVGPTGGNLWAIAFINAIGPVMAVADATDLFTSPAHGFVADQRVRLDETVWGEFPTGPAQNTDYWVISSGLTTDAFKVSTTQGGGALDVTASGVCAVLGYTPLTIAQNGTPQIQAGALVLEVS